MVKAIGSRLGVPDPLKNGTDFVNALARHLGLPEPLANIESGASVRASQSVQSGIEHLSHGEIPRLNVADLLFGPKSILEDRKRTDPGLPLGGNMALEFSRREPFNP